MRFLIIVHSGLRKSLADGQTPDPKAMIEMGKFNDQLAKAGVMQTGEGLVPFNKATRLFFPGGGKAPSRLEPPFAEDSWIDGFWIWNVKSKEEAVEWAKKAPMEDGATLEIRKIAGLEDFGPDFAEKLKAASIRK
ncbi:MAG TPA: YciI family protein [Candidatus Eisenbacteria bacterium]|nr:YciI family protein [Candidatus Eisenbacteria bacterium]